MADSAPDAEASLPEGPQQHLRCGAAGTQGLQVWGVPATKGQSWAPAASAGCGQQAAVPASSWAAGSTGQLSPCRHGDVCDTATRGGHQGDARRWVPHPEGASGREQTQLKDELRHGWRQWGASCRCEADQDTILGGWPRHTAGLQNARGHRQRYAGPQPAREQSCQPVLAPSGPDPARGPSQGCLRVGLGTATTFSICRLPPALSQWEQRQKQSVTCFSFALQSELLSGMRWPPTSKSSSCCARWVGAFLPLVCLEGWGVPSP